MTDAGGGATYAQLPDSDGPSSPSAIQISGRPTHQRQPSRAALVRAGSLPRPIAQRAVSFAPAGSSAPDAPTVSAAMLHLHGYPSSGAAAAASEAAQAQSINGERKSALTAQVAAAAASGALSPPGQGGHMPTASAAHDDDDEEEHHVVDIPSFSYSASSIYSTQDREQHAKARKILDEMQAESRPPGHRRSDSQKHLVAHTTPARKVKSTHHARMEVEAYVKELVRALHEAGLPIHMTQFYVQLVGELFGHTVHISAVYNTFFLTFGDSTICHMLKVNEGMSLSKMVDMYQVAEDVVRAKIQTDAGLERIARMHARPGVFPRWYKVPAHAVLSAAACPLFNGQGWEVLTSLFIGLLVGFVTLLSAKHTYIERGYEIIIGAISSLIAVAVWTWITPVDIMAVIFGGIIWALPGLRITSAMSDLSTGHFVTGTARFFSAIVTTINLGIGCVAGLKLHSGTLDPGSPHALWVDAVCVILCAFPVLVLLDGKTSHFPTLLAGSCIAYTAAAISGSYLGKGFGSWAGAFIVGAMSNVYGRWSTSPSTELSLFSIVMLVPGSFGVRSVLANDSGGSVDFFIEMVTIAVALVTGLFSANIFVPPSRMI